MNNETQMDTEGMRLETVTQGDCMDWLRKLPDGCADLVLTDPPYNIGKAAWDNIEGYVDWLCAVFDEAGRAAKDNATLVWWHNDIPQIAHIMTELERRGRWTFRSFLTFPKPLFKRNSWKAGTELSTLHSWYNICEYALVYVNAKTCVRSKSGLQQVLSTPEFSASIRAYFNAELERAGLTKAQFGELYKTWRGEGWTVYSHWFSSSQFSIPTREQYEGFFQGYLREKTHVADLFARPYEREEGGLRDEYEGLRDEYEGLRDEYEGLREVHNVDPEHCNFYVWTDTNNGALHPCRKPVDILRRLVRVHSNPGSLVIDPFTGSGSTGEACIAEHRRFAGCELDGRYCRMARERIAAVTPDLFVEQKKRVPVYQQRKNAETARQEGALGLL